MILDIFEKFEFGELNGQVRPVLDLSTAHVRIEDAMRLNLPRELHDPLIWIPIDEYGWIITVPSDPKGGQYDPEWRCDMLNAGWSRELVELVARCQRANIWRLYLDRDAAKVDCLPSWDW